MSRPPRKSGPSSTSSSGGGGGRRPPTGGGSRFDGPRKPYAPRDGDRPRPYGDRPRRDDEGPRRFNRDDGPPKRFGGSDGPRKPYAPRDGDRPHPYGDRPRRDGDAPKRFNRDDGPPKRYGNSDGPRKPYAPRDGDAPRRPFTPREGDRPRPYGDRPRRDGDAPRRPFTPRDGDRPRPYGDRPRRDGDAPKRFDRDSDAPRRPYVPRDPDAPKRGSRDPEDRPAWKSSASIGSKPAFKKRDPEDDREARRIELQAEERARKLAERAVLAEQFPKRDELVRKRRASRAVEAVLDERKREARKTASTRFKGEEAAPARLATRSKLTAQGSEPVAATPQPVKLAPSSNKPERIAKQLARAGVGSRRDIEQMIAAGRIAINGEELTHPAHNVANLDGVTLDGVVVSAAIRTTLYAFYKPVGCVTAARDDEGRTTVFDLLPEDMPRMISIGRLDYNTEGLLLLTNDGELARHLELPENHYPRSYRVRVFGRINEGALERLEQGVTIDGVRYGEVKATLERSTGANHWLAITIYEGKNREVRRICEYLGLTVSRLIRVGFGPFLLDELKEGHCVEIERSAWTAELPPPFGHGRKPKTPEGVKSKHTPRSSSSPRADSAPRGRDADHRR
jgi:23S rRNA pseudouridine2605 synthase